MTIQPYSAIRYECNMKSRRFLSILLFIDTLLTSQNVMFVPYLLTLITRFLLISYNIQRKYST